MSTTPYKPGHGAGTLCIHAGQRPDPATGARAVPVYQTTSYVFEDVEHAAGLYNLERPGHIYSRISNPTVAVLEERLAALEGGVGCVACASGHAALFLIITALMGEGAHIVASRALYGGSTNLLGLTLPRFGVTTTFVDPTDVDACAQAIRPETRMVFTELIGNPGLEITDIEAWAEVAHGHAIPLCVDATLNTPLLCKPLDWGADIVMHSLTKWIGGHGVALGGAVIEGGRLVWGEKFPTLTEPYAGYHGLVFAEEYGPGALSMRIRAEGLRDFGPALSPANAFYLLQGLETLHLRMPQHARNALALAQHLEGHEAVAWVSYPGLESHKSFALGQKYVPEGCGSVVSFGVRGGFEAAARFIQGVKLSSHLANVGDAKTLVLHPASTTHAQLSAEQMEGSGITGDMIRVSVGLESIEDIVKDFDQALSQARR